MRRDAVLAVVAFATAVAAMVAAWSAGWSPYNPGDYVLVAVASAACWPLAGIFPRTTLIAAAVLVSWPWWYFEIPDLRLLPFILAALRCATAGISVPFVAAVSVAPALTTVIPGMWQYLLNLFTGYGFWVVFPDPSRRIISIAFLVAVIGLGYAVREQRRQATALRMQNTQLEALRASDQQRVAQQVRTDIARDMHDVVAHHVSAMVIQAQAAERVGFDDADRQRDVVRAISAEGSEALAGMRCLVRVLRTTTSPPADSNEVPFAEAVEQIATRLRNTGTSVQVTVDSGAVQPTLEAPVLAILREAVTNIMLHARATTVLVDMRAVDGELRLRVRDQGAESTHAAPVGDGGNGLKGMRERVVALGGNIATGPHADGGWEVLARVPQDPQSALS